MGISIKFRRGTATEHETFTGAEGEITVQESDSSGDPWNLRVHDGLGGGGYLVSSDTSVATLTNKVLDDAKITGTLRDNSGNTLATVQSGSLIFEPGTMTLEDPNVVDQDVTKPIEQMIARIARKNQMILGD